MPNIVGMSFHEVILCLEATDVIFAIDSVSAKVGQIPNLYIAYSSSVLAIFSLRSMFLTDTTGSEERGLV
eukprot:5296077-Amphidinium_carterae.1